LDSLKGKRISIGSFDKSLPKGSEENETYTARNQQRQQTSDVKINLPDPMSPCVYLKKWTEGVAESGIENMRKGERIIVGEAILELLMN
jgi:hypothetical protein